MISDASLQEAVAPPRDAGAWTRQAVRYGIFPASLLFFWLAFISFTTALHPDEAAYKIVETGLFQGKWPYRDLFINRQPLTFLWYAPMGMGASIRAEGLFAAAMIAASVPVVAMLARRWLTPRDSSVAAVVYAVLLANPFLTLRANVEAFMLLPLAAALVVSSPTLAGALFGVAVMTKFHALVFAPVLLIVWRRQSHIVFLTAAAVCAVASLPFIFIWHDYWYANVAFALAYSRYTSGDRLAELVSVNWSLVLPTLPIWIAALVAAVVHRNGVLIVWAACGIVSIKASGSDFVHYYALLMPPLAILASDGVMYMYGRLPYRILLVASSAPAIPLFCFALSVVLQRPLPAPNQLLGESVAHKDGELYVLGDRSEIYAYAGRQPQRRFFSSIPLVMIPAWGEGAKAGLIACPPAILVVPDSPTYRVQWTEEIERLYGTREDHSSGVVFTNPLYVCSTPPR